MYDDFDLLGCATARNKGTCNNRLNIRRDALEASVLSGLQTHLMEPELFKEFCQEFTREVNRLRIERGADIEAPKRELERTDRELDKAVQAILKRVPGAKLKDKIGALEARKTELVLLANAEEPPPLLHLNMADIYSSTRGRPVREPAKRRRESRSGGGLPHVDRSGDTRPRWRSASDRIARGPGRDPALCGGQENPDFLSEAGALDGLLSQASVVAG
ncbi:hypothetical protein Q3C01_28165 [Bradyrhizobium sp. UFLA05-109]